MRDQHLGLSPAEGLIVTNPAIRCDGISKVYGGVQVLAPTYLEVQEGHVHALVGANGAGKSTLLGIISGRVRPTSGVVRLFGDHALRSGRPRDVRRAGVAAVYQELEIVPTLTAAANVFLGGEQRRLGILKEGQMRARFSALCKQLDVDIDPGATAGMLSVANQQALEILRALQSNARVLLMDEPTAALGAHEAEKLLSILRRLVQSGITIIFVSHQLDEVLEISNWITVLRDGVVTASGALQEWTKDSLITAMLGHSPKAAATRIPVAAQTIRSAEEPLLQIEGVTLRNRLRGVSLTVRRGEILGLTGLVGSGRTSLLRSLAGLEPAAQGRLRLVGKVGPLPRSPRAAGRLHIAMLPEDRKRQGLLLERPVDDNITLAGYREVSVMGVVQSHKQRAVVSRWSKEVDLRGNRPHMRVRMLSGGNQQKVVLARSLHAAPLILLADEPTRGIDIGAKADVLRLLRRLADDGAAVILSSSEIEEVVNISDRVGVMRAGRLVAELDPASTSLEEILRLSFIG